MNSITEDTDLPPEFDGNLKLFPLPNYVFFPGVVKGLHIFEPRYCAMLADALASDHLIALAVLKPGWENCYLGTPAIFPTVGVGRVIHHEPLPDGRHNILLRGVRRATVESEAKTQSGYRMAKASIVSEKSLRSDCEVEAGRRLLCDKTLRHSSVLPVSARILLPKLPGSSLCSMIDFLSNELPLFYDQKVMLLQEPSIDKRFDWLVRYFETFDVFESSGQSESKKRNGSNDDMPPRCSLN